MTQENYNKENLREVNSNQTESKEAVFSKKHEKLERFKDYEPTLESLKIGLTEARNVGVDEVLILYSICFLADHLHEYPDVDTLYEELYRTSLDFAFMKKLRELPLTETEKKLKKENPYFSRLIVQSKTHLQRAKELGAKELRGLKKK